MIYLVHNGCNMAEDQDVQLVFSRNKDMTKVIAFLEDKRFSSLILAEGVLAVFEKEIYCETEIMSLGRYRYHSVNYAKNDLFPEIPLGILGELLFDWEKTFFTGKAWNGQFKKTYRQIKERVLATEPKQDWEIETPPSIKADYYEELGNQDWADFWRYQCEDLHNETCVRDVQREGK